MASHSNKPRKTGSSKSRGQRAAKGSSSRPDEATPAGQDPAGGGDKQPAGGGAGGATRAARSTPIVGIGASAGGLEALQAFFAHMPPDSGIGFVVITHVRPGRESLMPELLGKVTSMTVVATEDGMRVEPNTVVVAKDSLLNIENGSLTAIKADSHREVSYHPIDHFFRALSADQGEHAIGVVLSGSGNDGTVGIKAIKAAGGMVMVQSPDSAKYTSMPDSAVATHLADYVLPAAELPRALVDYCRGPYLKLGHSQRPPLPGEAINAILVRLRAHTGQDFTCYKKSTMSRRIERRMAVHHLDSPQDYVAFLRDNPRELDLLQRELLISVTSFFRDPEAFEALADKGIAGLLQERPNGSTLRVWVAGCATGEEAYSVAILLREQINKAERMHDVQIFATDLDDHAIETARAGLYPESAVADLSPQRRQQFFSREDGACRIHKNIREMIVFATQNVVSDPPFTRLDLIVCRNVLIYLDNNAQQQVLPTFHYALRPGGLLFLGTSESLGEADQYFTALDSKHKVLRRRELPQHVQPPIAIPRRRSAGGAGEADQATGAPPRLSQVIERLLINEFAPCSVVVDTRGTLVYAHGPTGRYFQPEQGQPRNDILAMARQGLGPALSTALREAERSEQMVVRRSISVQTNGETARTDLAVRPLESPSELRGLLLVTLSPSVTEPKSPPKGEKPAPDDGGANAHDLERELQHTRETLQTTIEELETSNEELKSSNEELQSTNEELQSTNEELETSKEEMQSLNEELNTVNAELTSKVNALGRSNDDMNNLLNSMQVATIFLDADMRVKRYTEKARDVVRLISSDIGRPLSDLVSELHYPELIEDCRRVLATLIPREKEVLDQAGKWYTIRLMPYRTADNVIDGVVMTIVDVDRVKQAEEALRDTERRYRSLFGEIDEGFSVVEMLFDSEGRGINYRFLEVNPAFERHTGLRNAEGRLMSEVAPEYGQQWFEIIGQVALSGQPKRFCWRQPRLGQHYDLYAWRVGRAEQRHVAMLFRGAATVAQTPPESL